MWNVVFIPLLLCSMPQSSSGCSYPSLPLSLTLGGGHHILPFTQLQREQTDRQMYGEVSPLPLKARDTAGTGRIEGGVCNPELFTRGCGGCVCGGVTVSGVTG